MRKVIVGSVLFFVFASCCSFADATSSVAKPLWTLDLRGGDYSSGPYKTHSAPAAMRQIAFGSDMELVIVNDSGICGKSNPVTAFVLDSSSGKLLKKTKWVSNCWPYIFATAKSGYAVMTSAGMAVYSPAMAGVAATNTEVAAEWISPDGRVLGAWKQVPGKAITYLVDADTLRPTGIEIANRRVDTVAADKLAYVVSRVGSPDQIVIVSDGRSNQFEYDTKCGGVQAQFLSSDALAIVGCNRIAVVNAAGVELFSETNVGHVGSSRIAAVSRSGKRFALRRAIEKDGGDGPNTIIAERITVFDVNARKVVFAADIERLRGLESPGHATGIALSPEGELLAADSEGIVQLFALP